MSTQKWKVSDTEVLDFHLVVDESDDTIAEVYKFVEDGDGEYNARLIAAAPELFALVASAIDGHEYSCEFWQEWNEKAKHVMSKAKGGADG